MRLIKRYSNRRLYDARSSRTITQFDLAQIVQAGDDVQVIESDSGRDITAQVLGRVMLSEASRWGDVKQSIHMFREVITTGGDRSMSILKNTILASIGMLHVTRKKAEKIIDDLIKRGELDKSDRKKAIMELIAKAEKSTAGFRDKISNEAEKASKEVSKFAKDLKWVRASDLQKLKAKVDKLARAVKAIEAKL